MKRTTFLGALALAGVLGSGLGAPMAQAEPLRTMTSGSYTATASAPAGLQVSLSGQPATSPAGSPTIHGPADSAGVNVGSNADPMESGIGRGGQAPAGPPPGRTVSAGGGFEAAPGPAKAGI